MRWNIFISGFYGRTSEMVLIKNDIATYRCHYYGIFFSVKIRKLPLEYSRCPVMPLTAQEAQKE
jgi:hypothetical protein